MTTVYVSVPVSVFPPIRAEPDTTDIVVAVDVNAEVRVVCWEREEYFLVVIAVPYRRE
jgi:hypothetical protein